jgi:endonuclease YncB( thermonuclease family)
MIFSLLLLLALSCDVKVGRVTDGDTFYSPTLRVLSPTTTVVQDTRFRLRGVYAPEKKEPNYERAKADLETLIGGKWVSVVIAEKERDPYGGLIVDIYACDGTSINQIMRDRGWTDKGKGRGVKK